MEEVEYITKYIAVWGWQLMSIFFLIGALIISAQNFTTKSSAIFVGLVLIWAVCIFMMLKRKSEME